MLTLLVLKSFLLLTEILRHRMILLSASKFSVCIRFTRDAEPMENTHVQLYAMDGDYRKSLM